MKITLVEAMKSSLVGKNIKTILLDMGDLMEPIGICSIGAVLEKNGYEVQIVHQIDEDNSQIINKIIKFNPDIVGFSVFLANQSNSIFLATELKKRSVKELKIIFGNVEPSINPDLVENRVVDFVVIGEGEKTMLELVKSVEQQLISYDTIAGIAYFSKEKVIVTKPRERMTEEELAVLPFPLRDQLPMDKYKVVYLSYPSIEQQRFASINTSRGCIHNCSFCTSPVVWQRKRNLFPVGKVIKEIRYLKKNYGVNYLFVRDENFTTDRDNALEICDALIKNKIDINWYVLVRVDEIDAELLEKMSRAGCTSVMFGVETGTEASLKKMSKGIHIKQIIDAFELCDKYHIFAHALLMLGFPWENNKVLQQTYSFVESIKFDRLRIAFATPFKHTRYYEDVMRDGLLEQEYRDFDTFEPVVKTGIPKRELIEWKNRFYNLQTKPKYILHVLDKIKRYPEFLDSYIDWLKTLQDGFQFKIKND